MSVSANNDVVNNSTKFGAQHEEGQFNGFYPSNSEDASADAESVSVSVSAVAANPTEVAAASKEKAGLVEEILAQSQTLCDSSARLKRDWLEIEKRTYLNDYAEHDLLDAKYWSARLRKADRYLRRQNIFLHYEVLRLEQQILSLSVPVPPMSMSIPITSSENTAPEHTENSEEELELELGQIYTPHFDYFRAIAQAQRDESSSDESDVSWHGTVWE